MDPGRKKFYDDATRELIQRADTLTLGARENNAKLIYWTEKLRGAFLDQSFRKNVQIAYVQDNYPSAWFCISGSQFLSIMTGGSKVWQPMWIRQIDWAYKLKTNVTDPRIDGHEFMRPVAGLENYDVTFDQFSVYGLSVPYELARPMWGPPKDRYKYYIPDSLLKMGQEFGINMREMIIDSGYAI